MKKLIASFLLGFFLVVPITVFAIDLGADLTKNAAGTAGYDGNTDSESFAELIGTVIKGLLSFAGVIFLVLMVYAGFLWMTASGEESQIEKAQDIIRASIIGLIITVGAYTITAFVVPRIVSKTTGSDASLPQNQQQQQQNNNGLEGCCTVTAGGNSTKNVTGSESACDNLCDAVNERNGANFGDVDRHASCEFEFVQPGFCK